MSAVAPLVLRGNQTPRIFTAPPYVHSAGPEAIDLARMAGLIQDPWQELHLTAGLGEAADGRWAALEVAAEVPRQNGKNPEGCDTPILTLDGWTTFGDIAVGQYVYGSDGKPTEVVGRSEIYLDEDCYEVAFTDGACRIVGADHLWWTKHKDRRNWEAITTREIARSVGGRRSNGRMEYGWRVRCDAIVDSPEADLPIDPYIFGYWLGDGSSAGASLTVGHVDCEHICGEIRAAGYTVARRTLQSTGRAWDIGININEKVRDGFQSRCMRLGVWGDKHIPECYLTASPEQRLGLLRGLMDSDGSIAATNVSPQVEISSSYPRLAEGILRLLRSLGVRTTVHRSATTHKDRYRFCWTPAFNPFTLRRKAQQYALPLTINHKTMSITGVHRVPTVPVRCISVAASDGVYLTGHLFTPTHNSALEARQLTGLYILEEDLQIHSAHMSDTSVEQFLRVEALIEGTPELSRRAKRPKRGKGSEEIELHRHPRTGKSPRLRFRTRTGGGGRGFSCDTLYLDEAMILPEAFHGTLMPVLSARPNPQLWYTGSAVDEEEHEHGIVFTRLRIRGMAGGSSLVYLEFSLPVDSPDEVTREMAMDPANWALANPALGQRIDPDFVAGEQRSMSARAFAVERLGVGAWPDVSDDAGRVISKEQWVAIACKDEAQMIVSDRCFAVDVNPDRSWATIGSAGRRPDDLWHMAVVDRRRGTGWIVDRCVELYGEFRAPVVVDTKGPANNLIADLKDAGVEVIEADTTDYGVATSNFYDFVVNGGVRYPAPQPELSDAINDARKGKMGDAWKWSRLNSTSADITPLVACTLALWGASTREPDYANVLIAEDDEEPMEFGAQQPEVLSQADVTTCFACRTGGGCPIHDEGGN